MGSYLFVWWGVIGDGSYELWIMIVGGGSIFGIGLLGVSVFGLVIGNLNWRV